MATNKFLTLINNVRTLVTGISTSAGVADADKLIATNAQGKLDITLLPTGVGPDVKSIQASENLAAGDFVNVWNDAGTVKVRKADATDPAKQAHGFVLAAVTSGVNGDVYFEGANNQLSGLTGGTIYALSTVTPGGVVTLASASTTAGHILQVLGVATSATEINAEMEQPITFT